jgi:hypothetical protein
MKPRKHGPYLWNPDIARATEEFELSPVLEQYGSWVVTLYGVECLYHPCWIAFEEVGHDDWESHMREKPWCDPLDFRAALAAGRKKIAASKARLRYRVMKRDGFRCQLCGATAGDGARLEIDHKAAKSKGGSNEIDNLWTLCWECNQGKSDLDL